MASALNLSQLSHYASYIGLPTHYYPSCKPAPTLHLLTTLHIHHITTIPYENLVLHYSPTHIISLEPADLATKLTQNGRGGYCHEGATLFNHILRAYGFHTYIAGVRIRLRENGVPKGDFFGWYRFHHILTFRHRNFLTRAGPTLLILLLSLTAPSIWSTLLLAAMDRAAPSH